MILDFFTRHVKTNIAQYTKAFDLEATAVVANTHSNIIEVDGLEGEYTLRGGQDGIASKACLNNTHFFENGSVVADCYFGDDVTAHDVEACVINVGDAFSRVPALQMITEEDDKTVIIAYVGDARAAPTKDAATDSLAKSLNVAYTIGVFFKVHKSFLEEFGCTDCDKLFINVCIGAKKAGGTLVKFGSVLNRFYVGDSYVVEMEFGYIEDSFLDDVFKGRLQHFEAAIGGVTLEEETQNE